MFITTRTRNRPREEVPGGFSRSVLDVDLAACGVRYGANALVTGGELQQHRREIVVFGRALCWAGHDGDAAREGAAQVPGQHGGDEAGECGFEGQPRRPLKPRRGSCGSRGRADVRADAIL